MRRLLIVLVAFALVAGPSLAAADPWKDESGHGRGYEERGARDGDGKHRRGPPDHAGPPPHAGPRDRDRHERRDRERTRRRDGSDGYIQAGRCNRERIGQIVGAAAGAAVGSQIGDGKTRIAAIIGGAVAGVVLGGEIGRAMDRADHLCVDQTLEHAPTGRTVTWRNPDTQRRHAVTPQRTYQTDAGRYCREYTAKSTVGGETVQTYGTACRQPDGSWKIVNQTRR